MLQLISSLNNLIVVEIVQKQPQAAWYMQACM